MLAVNSVRSFSSASVIVSNRPMIRPSMNTSNLGISPSSQIIFDSSVMGRVTIPNAFDGATRGITNEEIFEEIHHWESLGVVPDSSGDVVRWQAPQSPRPAMLVPSRISDSL